MTKDGAIARGLRTAAQAIIGLVVGLVVVVWQVPGVPEAVTQYLQDNIIKLALAVGIPSGLAGYVWNLLRSDISNK